MNSYVDNLSSRWRLGILAWGVGAALLLYFHLCNVSAKPHYQFAALVPVVVAMLLWYRKDELKWGRTGAGHAAVMLVPFALLAFASYVFSPWLGAAALVLLGPAACFAMGGAPLLRGTWGIWLISAFVLPLPLRVDERLLVGLRNVATKMTSRILDYFDVHHMVSGNVIELPQKKLFVADACSGIHSLFVILAAAAAVAVWNRRGPIATFVLMLLASGLVMLENVLRLCSVSFGLGWGVDLSEGWEHVALGICLFALTLALLLSADQLIAFFSIWRTRRPFATVVAGDARGGRAAFFSLGILSLLLLPVQWWRRPPEMPNLAVSLGPTFDLPELGVEFMPESIGPFARKNYEQVRRVPEDPFGQHSQIWRYNAGDTDVSFSLNYTYIGVHDACLCYRNTGWDVGEEKILGVDDTGGAVIFAPAVDDWSRTVAASAPMSHPLEGHGLLVFSLLSEQGRTAVGLSRRKLGSTATQAAGRFDRVEYEAPQQYVQLQMVVHQAEPILEEQRAEYESLFRKAQAILFKHCQQEFAK